jgi:CubicO group peptidase (beta-lactamase class C family)
VDAERIREAARAVVAEHHLPGLAVGVVHGENLVYAEGFGFADIGARRPFRPESRQRIGSLTKTMVGLCVMALAEEGRLSLEDRVADLLPELVLHGDGRAACADADGGLPGRDHAGGAAGDEVGVCEPWVLPAGGDHLAGGRGTGT